MFDSRIFSYEKYLYVPYSHFDINDLPKEGEILTVYQIIDIWDLEEKKLVKEIRLPARGLVTKDDRTGEIDLIGNVKTKGPLLLSEKHGAFSYEDSFIFGTFKVNLSEIDDPVFIKPVEEDSYTVIKV